MASLTSGTIGPASPRSESDNAALRIAYDPATSRYTVTTLSGAYNFGPADRDGGSAIVDSFTVTAGNVERNLAIFRPGSGNTTLSLTYTSYGALQQMTENGTQLSVTEDLFVFGLPTNAADMPRSGTAAYTSVIDGLWSSDGDFRALTGSGQIAADFGAGTTSLSLNLAGVSVLGNGTRSLGMFSGTGAIDTAQASFSGALSGAASYSGTFAGRFFGPGAAEAGAAFNLSNGTGGMVSGVIVGRK